MNTPGRSALEHVKQPFESEQGRYFERYSSPHTHPGGSIWRTSLQKVRVLASFLTRRMALGPGRTEALEGLRRLQGSARDKEVLIIGSGPSAEGLNIREVKKRQASGELLVIATNYFLHSSLAQTVTPDYLVWADSAFDPSHPASQDAWERLSRHEDVTLVAPWTWQRVIASTLLASRTVYIDNDSLEGWSTNISPLKPRGYQGSTGVKALAVSLHLGPAVAFVIGIDLSYYRNFVVDENNRVLRQPTHLAGADSGRQDISNHSINGLADALYSTASQFLALRTHFSGAPVVNLDPSSLVDAFPKVSEHPLMKKTRKRRP